MRPLTFARTPSSESPLQPDFLAVLEAERTELAAAIANSKPAAVTKTETLLKETRESRSLQSEQVARLYAGHRESSPDKPLSPAILAADAELKRLDAMVGKLREQLGREREQWAPELLRLFSTHTDAAMPAVTHARAILEGVARVYSEADVHIANGLGSWASPKARLFTDIALKLQRLIKTRGPTNE